MDRMTLLLVVLCLGNLFVHFFAGPEEIPESAQPLRERIGALEKEEATLAGATAWANRCQSVLEREPPDNGNFLQRLQALAQAWKFTLHETAQSGENPLLVKINGVGTYRALAQLLQELGRNRAVLVNTIALVEQDDGQVNGRVEMTVRTSPWSGRGKPGERPEPLIGPESAIRLGAVDLFGPPPAAPQPIVGQPKIRYLGFYSGKGTPSGIIEENHKSLLIQPGDRTPSGLRVKALSPETIVVTGERGNQWTIRLEKSR